LGIRAKSGTQKWMVEKLKTTRYNNGDQAKAFNEKQKML
jgi:hypothetical protein